MLKPLLLHKKGLFVEIHRQQTPSNAIKISILIDGTVLASFQAVPKNKL